MAWRQILTRERKMRYIRQPGPPSLERLVAVPAKIKAFELQLPTGLPLLEAARHALAEHGAQSAILELRGGGFGPFAYVMPSLPVDDQHAAFYSAAFRPDGFTRLEAASMTFGLRDEKPFFHCHGLGMSTMAGVPAAIFCQRER